MATFRIHEDQENCIPDFRHKHNAKNVVAGGKRAVLGVIDSNKHSQNAANIGKGGKLPLGQNNQRKDKHAGAAAAGAVQPPVAQFQAIKVHEDPAAAHDEKMARIDERLKKKSSTFIYKGTAEDRFLSKAEAAEIERQRLEREEADRPKVRPADVELDICPMSVERSDGGDGGGGSASSQEELAESVLARGRSASRKDTFFEMEEYRDDIFRYLREHELKSRPKAGYMKKQPDVNANMRTILVDWLVEVAEEYKLQCETLYLAVNFIDRFLSYMSVIRGKLQLVGTAAMFLASKYEEIYPPDIGEFVYITDDTYNKRQVIRMEQLILKVLDFDLSIPTPLTFIHAICVAARLTEKTLYLAQFLGELAMLDGDAYLDHLPSVVAAAAVALARHTLREHPWSEELAAATGYRLDHLHACLRFQQRMHAAAGGHAQHAIQDKYAKRKYMMVSKLEPNPAPIAPPQ